MHHTCTDKLGPMQSQCFTRALISWVPTQCFTRASQGLLTHIDKARHHANEVSSLCMITVQELSIHYHTFHLACCFRSNSTGILGISPPSIDPSIHINQAIAPQYFWYYLFSIPSLSILTRYPNQGNTLWNIKGTSREHQWNIKEHDGNIKTSREHEGT